MLIFLGLYQGTESLSPRERACLAVIGSGTYSSGIVLQVCTWLAVRVLALPSVLCRCVSCSCCDIRTLQGSITYPFDDYEMRIIVHLLYMK